MVWKSYVLPFPTVSVGMVYVHARVDAGAAETNKICSAHTKATKNIFSNKYVPDIIYSLVHKCKQINLSE